jgi:hypothetical protein
LRTIELERQVIELEKSLHSASTEARAQNTYIAASRFYQASVSRYCMDLKERVRELDPSCPLLGCEIPVMDDWKELNYPEETTTDYESEVSDVVTTLAGMSQATVDRIDVDYET